MTLEQVAAVLLVVVAVGSLGFALFVVIFALCLGATAVWWVICLLRARWSTRRIDEQLDAAVRQWTGVSAD